MMKSRYPIVTLPARLLAIIVAGAGVLAVSGCRVGPNFTPPKTAMPEKWVGTDAVAAAVPTAATDLATWWLVFKDPVLDRLTADALNANLDLRLASSRLRQARASQRVATADLGPTGDATGLVRRSRSAAANGAAAGSTASNYQAGFDASWEIDLFGGSRRNREAAVAAVQSAEESLHDVQVTLAAEVARTYTELRTQQQRILIANQNLAAQRRTTELTRKRGESGYASRLDIASAEAQTATTAAQIPLLESAARQALYALAILLDREPQALLLTLSEPATIPAGPPTVPAGLPAELLRRRPDIRGAEADIHAATARIGVAVADLYPKITLGATSGWQAASGADLIQPLNRFWSLGPSVSWRIFDTGRTLSTVEVQKALQEQSILTYRKTVLHALQEVENALIAARKEQERRASLTVAAAASRRAVALATQLYEAGQGEYLDVLSAQRSFCSAEDALTQSTGAVATQLIALCKALGGGWGETL